MARRRAVYARRRRDAFAVRRTRGLARCGEVILRQLRTTDDWSGTKVAISSRTDEPAWAAELLDKFRVDDMVLGDCF